MSDELSEHRPSSRKPHEQDSSVGALIVLAAVSALLYGAIAWLAGGFAYGSAELERPIVSEYYQRCIGEDLGDATAGISLRSVS